MRSGILIRTIALAVILTSGFLQASSLAYQKEALTSDALPVFYPQLKQQMTFQDSWLAGKYRDFSLWRTHTRHVLRQALLTPDSTIAFSPQPLEQRDQGTYIAEKIALNITDESRVMGILLTPKSPGPHPAMVLLHDHGSKFDIGKEKIIRPWGNAARLVSAQAWS